MYKSFPTIVTAAGLMLMSSVTNAVTSEDPLRPPGIKNVDAAKVEKKAPKTWSVNEILHSEGRRLAIVNNKTVQQGDVVNGATVMDIRANQVTLKYKDKIINSYLSLVPVKKLRMRNTGR